MHEPLSRKELHQHVVSKAQAKEQENRPVKSTNANDE